MEQNSLPESRLHNKNLKYVAFDLDQTAGRNWKDFEESTGEGLKDNEENIRFQRKGSHCYVSAKSLATWLPAIAWKIKFA